MQGREDSGTGEGSRRGESAGGAALVALRRARATLVMAHPFFGDLALRLRLEADPSCHDLWSDGRVLGYNPAFACALPDDRLVGALAHEVLHLAFGHHLRRAGREERLWNRACDLAVNGVLLEYGFRLPEGYADDPRFRGRSADEIYAVLAGALLDTPPNRRGRSPDAASPSSETSGSPAPRPGGVPLGGPGEAAPSGGERQGERKGVEADAGSRAAQGKTSGRRSDTKAGFQGEVRDMPGTGDSESGARKLAEQEMEIAMSQAASRAMNMGSMPAGFLRLVHRARPPLLDWEELLGRFLERCADSDFTWTVPNRRYLWQDLYLPSRHDRRLSHVAVAVDCSGSVDRPMLDLFCSGLESVLESFDTTLTVVFHDTKVQDFLVCSRADGPLQLAPRGGGGTDFRPVPGWLARNAPQPPACLIWFTDLQCDRFPEEPPWPVLWVCPERGGQTPPFGEVVHMRCGLPGDGDHKFL